MAADDPKDLERIDQEIRINELKEEAKELAGGKMTVWESRECPPEVSEEFWRQVVEYEKAPVKSSFQDLQERGVKLPAPEEMDDAALTETLWVVIRRLAETRDFIHNTNHLSDRELYAELWHGALREERPDMSRFPSGAWHIDLIGSGSEEDIRTWLRYYADEEERRQWAKEFPKDEMPPHEDPPCDRDRMLPQPPEEPLPEWIPDEEDEEDEDAER